MALKSGPTNSILDIAGIRVGNSHDDDLKSGVTVILCDQPTIASAQVLGGGPGTRDVELLQPHHSVEMVDAIVLSGGSSFGLDAASGAQAWLREQKRGFQVGPVNVPIVPGAILFDLINGGNKDWGKYPPYRELAYQAITNYAQPLTLGTSGAGYGAVVAGLKGGLGTASVQLENGITLAAIVAVNALGSPVMGDTGCFWAHPFELDGEFGGIEPPSPLPPDTTDLRIKYRDMANPVANTTIAAIATDADLTKAQAKRLAIAAHDGFARAIWPVHTPLDGDIVFSLATGNSDVSPDMNDWIDLGAHAASVMSRAIARAIYEASPSSNDLYPTWKQKYG